MTLRYGSLLGLIITHCWSLPLCLCCVWACCCAPNGSCTVYTVLLSKAFQKFILWDCFWINTGKGLSIAEMAADCDILYPQGIKLVFFWLRFKSILPRTLQLYHTKCSNVPPQENLNDLHHRATKRRRLKPWHFFWNTLYIKIISQTVKMNTGWPKNNGPLSFSKPHPRILWKNWNFGG